MDTKNLWQTILSDIEIQVGKVVFQTFLSHTKLLSLDEKTATIGCTQPMLINLIEKRYSEIIKKTLDGYTKKDLNIVFTSIAMESKKDIEGPLFTIKLNPYSNMQSIRLNSDYTFDNFAVSSSNQMAYAAATAVANAPGITYNPLFLYGGTGVGKTHLMQGVGHAMIAKEPHTSIMYCTGEDFTNEIIEAIGTKTTVSFKKKYRRLNMLLIDDIQFIAGKNAVQEEFFHTFNAIQQSKGQIIMTSDRPPEEITKLEERLRTRFEGGLTIDIGQPDFELRTAILLIKAKQRGVDLPIDLAKLMSTNIQNLRKLEGIFIRAQTEAKTRNIPIDEELIKKILGKNIAEAQKKNIIKPEEILQAVADFYELKLSHLKGIKRDRMYSMPRQILYYLMKSELNSSLVDIGNLLGGRDHTTILHGIRKITEMISTNDNVKNDIMGIKQRLVG